MKEKDYMVFILHKNTINKMMVKSRTKNGAVKKVGRLIFNCSLFPEDDYNYIVSAVRIIVYKDGSFIYQGEK